MYVGGILSHIVIGAVVGTPDAGTAATVCQYKLMSAYIQILPGLGLKIAFLSVNAFVFLVPMMPELLALAQASPADGPVSEAFHTLEAREALVGMSNVIPLVTEIIMGAVKPRLLGERRPPAMA